MNYRGRKRILFLVSSMEGGGAERVAALLCNDWVDAGYDVILMPTFSRGGAAHTRLTVVSGWSFLRAMLVALVNRSAVASGACGFFGGSLEISNRTSWFLS